MSHHFDSAADRADGRINLCDLYAFPRAARHLRAESIQTVFLVAVPIAALAFLATWLIPLVELKRWPEASKATPDAEMAMTSVTVAPETQPQQAPEQEAAGTHVWRYREESCAAL